MILDPVTGEPVNKSLMPPAPANTVGNAKPLFSNDFLQAAESINGTELERQKAIGGENAPMYDINKPKYNNKL